MSQPFDLSRLTLNGDRVAVAGNVFAFSASSSAIATRPPLTRPLEQLVWRDRHGVQVQRGQLDAQLLLHPLAEQPEAAGFTDEDQ